MQKNNRGSSRCHRRCCRGLQRPRSLEVPCSLRARSRSRQQPDVLQEVKVTGSRIITDNVRSPTPITSVSVEDIAKTTPSDIPDALNKLPEILGGRTPRTQGNASTNNGGNVLSLRNFGASRTLVLLDGHRVPTSRPGRQRQRRYPAADAGEPGRHRHRRRLGGLRLRRRGRRRSTSLLDKKFTGLKVKADVGISEYGDGEEGQFRRGLGHRALRRTGSFRNVVALPRAGRDSDPLTGPTARTGRPGCSPATARRRTRSSTRPTARVYNSGPAGNVNCGTACALQRLHLQSAGRSEREPAGSRHTHRHHQRGVRRRWRLREVRYVPLRIDMKDAFGRLSYDFTDNVNGYVQATWAQAGNESNWIQWVVSPSASRPNTLFANNPFLAPTHATAAGREHRLRYTRGGRLALLATAPATSPQTGSTPPAPPTTPYFSSAVLYLEQGRRAGCRERQSPVHHRIGPAQREFRNGSHRFAGQLLTGMFSTVTAKSRLKVTNPNNTDNGRYLASLDAVIAPPGTMVNGVNVGRHCRVLGVDSTAIRQPLSRLRAHQYRRPERTVGQPRTTISRRSTSWTLRQKLDDVGASIGGGLWGLGLPAGEIRANLSVDARWATYEMESDALPTEFVNCTGLRMCLANGGAPVRWVQNTNAPVDASNHVIEGALEVNVPLLKDVPAVQELSTNLGGSLHQVFILQRRRILEGRSRLAPQRYDPLPRHAVDGYSRAQSQRPLPAGRRFINEL